MATSVGLFIGTFLKYQSLVGATHGQNWRKPYKSSKTSSGLVENSTKTNCHLKSEAITFSARHLWDLTAADENVSTKSAVSPGRCAPWRRQERIWNTWVGFIFMFIGSFLSSVFFGNLFSNPIAMLYLKAASTSLFCKAGCEGCYLIGHVAAAPMEIQGWHVRVSAPLLCQGLRMSNELSRQPLSGCKDDFAQSALGCGQKWSGTHSIDFLLVRCVETCWDCTFRGRTADCSWWQCDTPEAWSLQTGMSQQETTNWSAFEMSLPGGGGGRAVKQIKF